MSKEASIDRILLRRFCCGCEDSFSELVSRHESQVYGIALAILKNNEQAERVLQRVFTTFAKQARQLEEARSLRTGLYRYLQEALVEEQLVAVEQGI